MDQYESASWILIILASVTGLVGVVKGALSLFRRASGGEGFLSSKWTIDWGGIGAMVLILLFSAILFHLGLDVVDRAP